MRAYKLPSPLEGKAPPEYYDVVLEAQVPRSLYPIKVCRDCGLMMHKSYAQHCRCVDAGTPADLKQADADGRLTRVGRRNAAIHNVPLGDTVHESNSRSTT